MPSPVETAGVWFFLADARLFLLTLGLTISAMIAGVMFTVLWMFREQKGQGRGTEEDEN